MSDPIGDYLDKMYFIGDDGKPLTNTGMTIPGWIKSSERRPPEYERVLTWNGVEIGIDYNIECDDGDLWAMTLLDDHDQNRIEYWMPMPPSPKEKE